MTTYPGSCHCGAVKIQFTSDKKPEEMRVGRCACSFCRRHGARTLGDPAGSVEFRAAPSDLSRYRFGLGITDYLLCAKCGTYLGAVMPDDGRPDRHCQRQCAGYSRYLRSGAAAAPL